MNNLKGKKKETSSVAKRGIYDYSGGGGVEEKKRMKNCENCLFCCLQSKWVISLLH